MDLAQAKSYFDGHVNALKGMLKAGDPWVFLCGSAVIDYLTRMANGAKTGRKEYIEFIKTFMPSGYKTFTYSNGRNDLSAQMYHILRSGLVHSFSLTPTEVGPDKGRPRSIVLTHSGKHLSPYTEDGFDACQLNATGFVNDIQHAVDELFANEACKTNIVDWLKIAPPVGVIRFIDDDEEPC